MLSLLLAGIGLGVAVAAPIGPVNLAVIRRGLLSGFRPAWMLGLGAALADMMYVIVIFLGLAPFLEQSPTFRLSLWTVGGMFLVYLGITGFRPRAIVRVTQEEPGRKELHPFITGLGITLLNPMTVVSWLVVGGAFFSTIALGEQGANGGVFAAGIFVGSALWSGSIAFVLHFARRLVSDRGLYVVSAVASVALIGFGLAFLIQAIQSIWSG